VTKVVGVFEFSCASLKLFESVITNTKDAILITDAEPFEGMGIKSFMSMPFTK
jgi:hypothetical protein